MRFQSGLVCYQRWSNRPLQKQWHFPKANYPTSYERGKAEPSFFSSWCKMYFFQGNNGSKEIKPIQQTLMKLKQKGSLKSKCEKTFFCYLLIKTGDFVMLVGWTVGYFCIQIYIQSRFIEFIYLFSKSFQSNLSSICLTEPKLVPKSSWSYKNKRGLDKFQNFLESPRENFFFLLNLT